MYGALLLVRFRSYAPCGHSWLFRLADGGLSPHLRPARQERIVSLKMLPPPGGSLGLG